MNDRPITEFFRPIPGNGFLAPMYRIRANGTVDRFDGALKLWERSTANPKQLRDPKQCIPIGIDEVKRIKNFGI